MYNTKSMKQFNLQYPDIIRLFTGKKILVIGDLILDVYLKGSSRRLSPEAPVPVVDIEERTACLGGAANTVCNLKALGAIVDYCSVAGTDKDGAEAIQLLKRSRISCSGIIRDPHRKTITKTRVVSGAHVITRLDEGTTTDTDNECTNKLIQFLEENYHRYDAVVISDYDKGTITAGLLQKIGYLQRRHAKFLVVDSRRLAAFASLRPSLIKPNYEETIKILGWPTQFTARAEQLKMAGELLFKKLKSKIIALTLDSEGSLIFENGELMHRCFAPAVSAAHVSGAGDTYLAAFVLGYISSCDTVTAAEIATAAAAIAVKKESTSVCTAEELVSGFSLGNKYISSMQQLKHLCDEYHAQGRRIIFTNGCFDILHSGHVTYLHSVKRLGDVLIVGVNKDESIRRLKGTDRPINTLGDRVQVLAGLGSVDHIVPFGSKKDDTPIPVIKAVRPHIFAKGGDYTRDKLPEAGIIEELGGEIVFVPHVPDHSTTAIIKRIHLSAFSAKTYRATASVYE